MTNGCEREDIDDSVDQSCAGESEEISLADGSGEIPGCPRQELGLTERLAEALVEEGDGDLLLQQSNREDTVLEWLQALDFQAIGACRADERLKPLLKLNASSGVADDGLLVHLSQHFEPAEVGMLARCFCMPLVSIRVGKINKRGTLLCPATSRGNLNLTLLPTSDLRLSFAGDDGQMELIVTLSNSYGFLCGTIEEMSEDTSGRSFVIKISDGRAFFFWCSEKSKLLGGELLGKMRDLLYRRPSVAEFTGIDESRLECFATYLRAYLMGSATCNTSQVPTSLGPKLSSSEEATPRCFLWSSSSITIEELKKQPEIPFTILDHSLTASLAPPGTANSKSGSFVNLEESNVNPFSPGFLESIGKLTLLSSVSSVSQVPFTPQPIISPYYCWCPPGASTSQQLSTSDLLCPSMDDSLSPPSLLKLVPSTESLSLADLPPLDFPAFLPDPLVSLPRSASQQIPTFTPLICDPIVHIPIIDVCSTGQGYLVSAGPAVTTTIPPLHTMLVNPLVPERDSVVEEGARETLRLLLSGSGPTNPPLLGVLPLPSMLADEKPSSAFVAGGRGLYCGIQDIDAIISTNPATIGLISLPGSDQCSDFLCCGDDNVNKDADKVNPDSETEGTT